MTDKMREQMRDIVREFTRDIGMYSSALFITASRTDPSAIFASASCGLFNTGVTRIIVTCGHVLKAYQEFKNNDPSTYLGLGTGRCSTPIDISEFRVVDQVIRPVDLATIEIPHTFDLAEQHLRLYTPRVWPQPKVSEGEMTITVGYPGQHRRAITEHMLEWNSLTFLDIVTSCNDYGFFCVDEENQRVLEQYNADLSALTSVGGLSGAPVFKLDTRKSAVAQIEWAGVVVEAIELQQGTSNPLLKCHGSRFIRRDGTIDVKG